MVVMEEVVVLGPRQRFSDMTTLAATCGNVLFWQHRLSLWVTVILVDHIVLGGSHSSSSSLCSYACFSLVVCVGVWVFHICLFFSLLF